jgi:outer membrane protein TolC
MHGTAKRFCRVAAASVLAVLLCQAGGAAAQEEFPSFLRLSDAIQIALEGSTQLGIREANLDAARTARWASIFGLFPDLRFSAVTQKATRTDYDLPQSVTIENTITTDQGNVVAVDIPVGSFTADTDEISAFKQIQFSSAIRLFDGLANYYRIGASNAEVRANEYDHGYTHSLVQTSVIEAYYNLLRGQLLHNVAREAVDVAQEQLERTQALYELGSAARSDVLKSQVQLGQTRLQLVQARNGERLARDGLVHAMNLMSAPPFAIDTTVVNLPEEDFEFGREVQHAQDNRLDLMALRETETAQSRRVTVARGPLFPSVDFGYNLAYQDQESQFRFGAQQTRNRFWFFQANWNIFDRYQVYANISQAKANRRIAEFNRRQTELDAVREIRDYINQIQEARERFVVARENVERSREDLRLAQEKFRVGAGTILDTITAESDLTSTKAAEVEAVVDYLISRARLYRATGRDFTEF